MRRILLTFLSPMDRQRLRAFMRQRRAVFGLIIFWIIFFFSMTAELWSHHYPLLIVRDTPVSHPEDGSAPVTKRKIFFPALITYSVEDFGIEDAFTVDFNQLLADDAAAGKDTFAIFPFNPWDPYIQTSDVLAAPSPTHRFGTDNLGRDVLARLIYGIRVSLSFGLIVWILSYILGVIIGVCQGYFIGKFDFIVERFKELAEIIPFLTVVILVNGITKSNSFTVTLGIVLLFFWINISSQMRAQVLGLRQRDFAEACRAMGGGSARIIFKHILPNALTPVLTLTPFAIAAGISTLTVLDYLGFGLSPPTPSIGELLAQGRAYITNAAWLLIAPTSALVMLLIAINMIGESLRNAFDPRSGK